MNSLRRFIVGSSLISLCATASICYAETGVLEEVVVTAQKREQSLLEVPVSMNVYSGEDLLKNSITNMTALAEYDASLNINYDTLSPILSIRGVSSGNTTETGDPAVSTAFDGIFNNRPYGLLTGMYDIARVEILRGPQGTLFGRNSTGGVVNVMSNRPTDEHGARVTFEAGSYDLLGADGFINLPLTDSLSIRASFMSRQHSGYQNLSLINSPEARNYNIEANNEDVHSGRFQVLWQPTEALEIWALAQYTSQDVHAPANQSVLFNFKNGVNGEPIHEKPAGLNRDGWDTLVEPNGSLRASEFRGGVDYSFANGMSLHYLGGYIDQERYWNTAFTGYGNGFPNLPMAYSNRQNPETTSHEVRLESADNDRFTWLFGGFYFEEKGPLEAYVALNPFGPDEVPRVRFDIPVVVAESWAAFANFGFDVTDRLNISAGARYSDDDKHRTGTFSIYPLQTGLPFILRLPFDGQTTSNKTTWQVTGTYSVSDQNNVYAKISTGYKAGGYSNAINEYGPETVTSYEIGNKSRLLNGRMQLNLAAFYMDYTDQQVTQFVAGDTSSGSITVNAGESTNYGLEADLQYVGENNGVLSTSLAWTHARFDEFVVSAGWNSTINLDHSGNKLPFTPDLVLTARYDYPFTLDNGAQVTPYVFGRYQSEKYYQPGNYNSTKQEAFSTFNVGVSYMSPDQKWEARGYVDNVTDKTYFTAAAEFYLYYLYQYQYGAPRTFGVQLTYNF